jgi:hypothetical protein
VGLPMVPLTSPTTLNYDEKKSPDDIHCKCDTPSSATNPTSSSGDNSKSISAINNNLSASSKKINLDTFSPYIVSVKSPAKKSYSKTTSSVNTPSSSISESSVAILPPLHIHQQQLHHPSNRKSARKSGKIVWNNGHSGLVNVNSFLLQAVITLCL